MAIEYLSKLPKERGQLRVTPRLRLVERRAGRVDVGIGIGSMFQQDLGELDVAGDRALAQRIAPLRDDIVDPLEDA